jgi:hypothetical protein
MKNIKQFLKDKYKYIASVTGSKDTYFYKQGYLDCLNSLEKLINKPVETTNEEPKLNDYDKQTLKYVQECLDEELSIPCDTGKAYDDAFLPRWEEFKKRFVV